MKFSIYIVLKLQITKKINIYITVILETLAKKQNR